MSDKQMSEKTEIECMVEYLLRQSLPVTVDHPTIPTLTDLESQVAKAAGLSPADYLKRKAEKTARPLTQSTPDEQIAALMGIAPDVYARQKAETQARKGNK